MHYASVCASVPPRPEQQQEHDTLYFHAIESAHVICIFLAGCLNSSEVHRTTAWHPLPTTNHTVTIDPSGADLEATARCAGCRNRGAQFQLDATDPYKLQSRDCCRPSGFADT